MRNPDCSRTSVPGSSPSVERAPGLLDPSMIFVMLNRILANGVLVLGAGVAANVLFGKLFSRRRSRPATDPQLPDDLDFTSEQNAILALIRQQIAANGPVSGEAG